MRKILTVVFVIILVFGFTIVYANNQTIEGLDESKIVEAKKNTERKLEEYRELYGSDSYGMVAFILSVVRIYSIPFCIVGIAVSAIYQYTIGIRRLDVRDKGFLLTISFVTILVICQILPLIFAIVIRGWRN